MKATNQFDYPTATATNYKAYRDPVVSPSDNKGHYKRVIKLESQNERERVKTEQQKKKEQEVAEQQARIRDEIERKRRELQELERKKIEAMESQRRAFELAKIKDEQDKLKRLQQEQKMKQYDENANFRFKDALRRLQAEKEEAAYKERQAMQRRRANQEMEKEERERTAKYQVLMREREVEERAQRLEEEKRNEELYRGGVIKHGLAKNIDYSKTCFHNPKLVFKYDNEEEQVSAFKKGEEEQLRQKQLSAKRRERSEEDRRRSLQRGEKALQRIDSHKEYRAYCEQAEKQQRQYNLKRIEEGKKDQYTQDCRQLSGLKPLTLGQLEVNKKIRSQQQFEEMFIKSSGGASNGFANKYTIMETKFNPIPQSNYSHWKETQQQENSLDIYNPSTKYAFEEHDDSLIQPRQIRELPNAIKQSVERNKGMTQTRAGDGKYEQKEQLSYSQSEDDSSYA